MFTNSTLHERQTLDNHKVSVIQMQWSPEAGAKGTFDQADHSTY